MEYLFPNFLADQSQYAAAENYWRSLWNSLSEFDRHEFGWATPWFENPPFDRDGNPIFTAIAEKKQKAIRVIQFQSTSSEVQIDWWLDTFGGEISDAAAIRELVIACALSVEATPTIQRLLSKWIVGELEVVRENPFGPYDIVAVTEHYSMPTKFYELWPKAA